MRPVLFVLLCLAATAAVADSHGPVRNLVSLSVRASEQVDNDLLVVQLFSEHEAREQAPAADAVNKDVTAALATIGAVKGVKVQTLEYHTHPVYDDQRVTAWRVRQALQLESTDAAALTRLVGSLQEKLGIQGMSYQVSTARREEVEARLTEVAIQRFSARAERVTQTFGRRGYTLVNVDIDNSAGGNPPPIAYAPRMAMMKAEAAVAEPGIAAGVQTLEVGIRGTIELAAP